MSTNKDLLKITMVMPSVSHMAGGLFYVASSLANTLLKTEKLSVRVYGLKDEATAADLPSWGGVNVEAFDVVGPRIFGYSPKLLKAIKADNPDLMHVHGLWTFCSLANLIRSYQKQSTYLISPHGMLDPWALHNSYWKKYLAGLLYERFHLRNAACIHALCESEARAIREYGLKNPICIIPNGVDIPDNQTVSEEVPWKKFVPSGSKILLYLGRIHPKKNVSNLIKAWEDIKKNNNNWHEWWLVIAGWSQVGYEEELKKLVNELNIENIVFIGPQFGEDKSACYMNADGFILPSLSEGIPMTILEAWSHRLPVIMTDECNLPQGYSANAAIRIGKNVPEIATGIMKLYAMSEDKRIEMGNMGRALVEQKFSWPMIANQMADVYQWLLGKHDKPDCVI